MPLESEKIQELENSVNELKSKIQKIQKLVPRKLSTLKYDRTYCDLVNSICDIIKEKGDK